MAALGSLVVSLEANIAKFTSDMGKASKQTEDAMKRMESAAKTVQGALAALGIGASVGGLGLLIKGSIDAADHMRDMSQKTGIAVEALNGLAFAAGQAGGNLDSMVAAAGKLNKSIVEAAGGNGDVQEAFSKLGISVRDASGQLKSADVVMAEIADQFGKFADGPEKTAIAVRLFGKAGADMIPVLNDGGAAMRENIAYAKQYGGVTAEMAAAADNFNDTMGKLEIQQKSFGNAMTAGVLPVLQTVADEMLGASEKSDKFALAATAARTVLETFVVVGSEVGFVFKAFGTEIGGIAAQLDRLAHGDIKGFNAISEAMTADAEKAAKEHQAFIDKVLDRTPKVDANGNSVKPKPAAPTLRVAGDDPAKAQLDGHLKAIESAYAREREASEFHDQFMQELRNQDLVDAQTYSQYKVASIEQARDAAVKAYDDEIKVLEKARAAATKDSDKDALTNQIAEKSALRDKARADAMAKLSRATLDMSAAQNDLNKQMKEWDRQQDQAVRQLEFTNDLYGKSALEIAKLTEARRLEFEIEEKIRQAQEKGAITEESIAKFRKDAADHASRFSAAAEKSSANQIKTSLMTPQESENQQYANHIADLQAYQQQSLEAWIEGNSLIERENQRHAISLAEIQAANNSMMLSVASQAAGDMYTVLKNAGAEKTALAKSLFLAQKAIAIAEIIVATNAAAEKAQLEGGTFAGFSLASIITAAGYARAGIVAGTAIAEASASGGYDIPGGVNPVTQLHEKEMVLPKAQAEVIRGLASRGGVGSMPAITYAPSIHIDSRSDQAQVRQLVSNAVRQGNADLVDKLQRAGKI